MSQPAAYRVALEQFCQHKIPAIDAYRNNQAAGHSRALASNFPVIKMILSEPVFNALAEVFARHYQPLEWDINRYGAGFSEFLLNQQHGGKADAFDWHWLAQIAALEYAIILLYYQHNDTTEFTLTVAEASQVIEAVQLQHPYVVCFNPQTLSGNTLHICQQKHQHGFAIMVSATDRHRATT